MLRVTGSARDTSCFSVDKKRRQVSLQDPSPNTNATSASADTSPPGSAPTADDRRPGVAAPRMFAFDAIFDQEDEQVSDIIMN